MKVGLVSPYDFGSPGGVNQHIAHLATEFTNSGLQVRIIAPSSVPAEALGRSDLTVVGRPYPLPADGSVARMAISLRLSGPVKRLLAAEQFDVLHLHEPLQGPLPITVLRHSTAVNIGTFHAFSDSRYSTGSMAYYYGRRLLRRWFRKLDGKIAVSEAAAEFVGQFFPGYYNVIPNGIDHQQYSSIAGKVERFDDGMRNIIFIGRLESRKGVKYLLRAFRRVKAELPDTRLLIVGKGERQRAGYQRWVERADLTDVHFLGFMSEDEKVRLLHTSHVFCAPSTGDESFGVVLLEAMASGLAIVASNIRGYASVITDGIEGRLVPPKDEASLALGLLQLLSNSGLRHEMGTNGQIKAREYSWDRVARRVLSYYDRILREVQKKDITPSIQQSRRSRLRNFVSPLAPYVGLRR